MSHTSHETVSYCHLSSRGFIFDVEYIMVEKEKKMGEKNVNCKLFAAPQSASIKLSSMMSGLSAFTGLVVVK